MDKGKIKTPDKGKNAPSILSDLELSEEPEPVIKYIPINLNIYRDAAVGSDVEVHLPYFMPILEVRIARVKDPESGTVMYVFERIPEPTVEDEIIEPIVPPHHPPTSKKK